MVRGEERKDQVAMSKNRASIQEKGYRPQLGTSGQRWKPSVFDFKAGSTCPTCQGTGRIPRGQEDELVALIPYKDDRLKSHKCRTCCYVTLILVVLLITGGLLIAFLLPRDVHIDVIDLNSTKHWVAYANSSHVDAILEVQTSLDITNSNFFPLKVNVLNVTLSHLNYTVGSLSYPLKTVAKRTRAKVNVIQNATFTGSLAKKIINQCFGQNWTNYIYMQASVVLDYKYLSYSSDVITSGSDFFRCDFVHGDDEDLNQYLRTTMASCHSDGCNSTTLT